MEEVSRKTRNECILYFSCSLDMLYGKIRYLTGRRSGISAPESPALICTRYPTEKTSILSIDLILVYECDEISMEKCFLPKDICL